MKLGLFGRLVAVVAALQLGLAPVQAQTYRPGFQPGFKSGFQFLAAPTAGLSVAQVFATSLTGAGSQSVTNGLDLAGQGGMLWGRARNYAADHVLTDTARGVGKSLASDLTTAEVASSDFQTVTSTGFTLANVNGNLAGGGASGVVWSFRQHPRFFKVITYTGNGTTQVIPHGLDPSVSVGMVIIKRRDAATNWTVWHRGLSGTGTNFLALNTTAAAGASNAGVFGNNTTAIDPAASGVTVGSSANLNASGGTYVMYVFAHDTASDGVIQCVSVTADASGNASYNTGWANGAQYVMQKASSTTGNWLVFDTARTPGFSGVDAYLEPNATAAEATYNALATSGSTLNLTNLTASSTNILLLIRAP